MYVLSNDGKVGENEIEVEVTDNEDSIETYLLIAHENSLEKCKKVNI